MTWILLLAEQGGVLDGAMRGALKGAIIGGVVGGLFGLGYALVNKFKKKPTENDEADDHSSGN